MAPSGSSSSMASYFNIGATAFLLTMWIGYFFITGAAAIPREELDDMIPVLRLRGYNRFENSVKKSDLTKHCIAFDNLTLFAPADESMEVAHISGEFGLRSHAVSDLILLPSPAILTTLLPNHTLSIAVHRTRRTLHIAVNGVPLQSPGLYHSSHGLAGALIPLSHFPSCCLPQSPNRAILVETPSLSAYAGPHAFRRPQSASSNGDLLPPLHPPETLDISIGFSISSTIAALTSAAFAAGVFIHLCHVPRFPSRDEMVLGPEFVDNMFLGPELDNDMFLGPELENDTNGGPEPNNNMVLRPEVGTVTDDDHLQYFGVVDIDHNEDGFILILRMILNTLHLQFISVVSIDHEALYPVSMRRLGVRLRRYYISRLEILTQPQYAMHRTPDNVIMVIEMPDWTRLHLGQFPHYVLNSLTYDNSFVLRIFSAQEDPPTRI